MANVFNRTTRVYKKSVNTPEYPTSEWIINPDVSALANVPVKYWKATGDLVEEMTQAEKDAVDTELTTRRRAAMLAQAEATFQNDPVQLAVVKLFFKEINKLRVKNGDPAYTVNQFNNALQAELEASVA